MANETNQTPPTNTVASPVTSTEINGNGNGNSTIAGVSVRAWLAVLLILSVCILSFMVTDINETLKSLALIAAGFYFGQNGKR